jgi:hypothetical protein
MRIIDEETIIIGEYPEGVSDGPQINANIEYLNEEVKTAFGHSYRIIRIPMPPDETDAIRPGRSLQNIYKFSFHQ